MIKLKTGEKIKDHTELGISFREWCALFAAWGVLAHGMLPHTKPHKCDAKPGLHLFNMHVSCEAGRCGTVGCIGGNMALAMGMDVHQSANFVDWSGEHNTRSQGKFYRLFFPRTNDGWLALNWNKIDGIHAAEAIWNFLRTGQPDWDSIIPHLKKNATYKPYKGKVLDHVKLKISFTEWLALIGVRVMLDSGAINHARDVAWNGAMKFLAENEGAHVFNMGQPLEAAHCGTVGCIGGYMGTMMYESPRRASRYVMDRDPEFGGKKDAALADLFFPRIDGGRTSVNYDEINTKLAVQAIDNFLTTGKPNWDAVLG